MVMFNPQHRGSGFTLVEIMIVIAVVATLATIGVVSYFGIKKSAAMSVLIDNTKKAGTAIDVVRASRPAELADIVEGSTVTRISNKFEASPQVITKIFLKEPVRYEGLSVVQNAVLFHSICTNLSSEKRPDATTLNYGQGLDRDGKVAVFTWGPDTCNVYNKDRIQFNSSWGFASGALDVPVEKSLFTGFISKINNTNTYFPDANHVAKQYYQTVLDRFERQGGTFPITTFWDGSWCSVGQSWCTAREPLPDPVNSHSNHYYCVEAYHKDYPEDVYVQKSQSSKPEPGRC